MPLQNKGFDIKLEEVSAAGLPKNRSMWCYTVTLPPNSRHRAICLDFKGKLDLTDPKNFDAKTATDSPALDWGEVSYDKVDPNGPVGPKNTKTTVCWKAKDNDKPHKAAAAPANTVRICFIGPADGRAGDVSLETNSFIKEEDSNKGGWADLDHGSKEGLEAPLAAALNDDEANEELASIAIGLGLSTGLSSGLVRLVNGELTMLFPDSVTFDDPVDFDALVDVEIPSVSLADLAATDLRAVRLAEDQVRLLREAFDVSSIQDLLDNPDFERLTLLFRALGGRSELG